MLRVLNKNWFYLWIIWKHFSPGIRENVKADFLKVFLKVDATTNTLSLIHKPTYIIYKALLSLINKTNDDGHDSGYFLVG